MKEDSHFHLSSREGEAHVQSTVMRAAAQAADATSLVSSAASQSSTSSGSVSRGRPHQAHHRGSEADLALAVVMHLPQEGPGFGEGGHRVPHDAGRRSLDGRRIGDLGRVEEKRCQVLDVSGGKSERFI